MSYELIAIMMFAVMMLLLVTGQRVFGAIGFVGAVFAIMLWGTGGEELPFNASITALNWEALLTLPMFIYMGYMLSESGIAGDLFRMFHVWSGPLRGGLAIGTLVLMIIIAALNGLSVAGMAIGTSIALPELLKRNYDKIMVTGVIQGGSTLGIMMPPSIVLILFGVIARVPVGQLWLGGILPALLMTGLFIGYVVIRCWINPSLGPAMSKEERAQYDLKMKIRLLGAGLLPLAIFLSMTGLFVMGYTSLVEMSAVGATAATLATMIKGKFSRDVVLRAIRSTLSVTCMFMWIIVAALSFGAIFDGLGASHALESFFTDKMGLSPLMIILLMQLAFIILGMFLDDTAMLIIVAPLFLPIVAHLGYSPIWFGVLYTVTVQLAYMTPPFGYNLFLMRAMAPPEIRLEDIYRSIVPFALLMLLTLAILMIFPEIVLWLPEQVYGR